ncbi:hypothetical protein ASF49_13255 [Methylobacterium sp. Leaf104]|nr:hypothetical protein ASF49_13255 [Methylobacterium sp. Leaf104]MCI9879206.1 DUF1476 family protein [Methylobacterium goesingense]
MARFFEERERAAEMLFVRAEESRFLTHCQGVRSLAGYAAEALGVDQHSATAYADELLAAVIQGVPQQDLVERVRGDLEANGVVADPAILTHHLKRPSGDGPHGPRPA